MPEILTESFCERCGTRYTFESAAPTKARKLGKFKTLSKGLKNYVLSDESSMDEAMAAARSDAEREVTSQQLDAFHATFNFCMTCRQYTCGNCWNEVEGSCLTCAPHLGHEIIRAPFPELTPLFPAESPSFEASAWPATDLVSEDVAATPELDEVAAVPPAAALAPAADADAVPAAAWPVEAEQAAEAESVAMDAWASAEPAAIEPRADAETRAASAAHRTADLLAKFRPGQSLDDELDAYEASVAPDPVAAEQAPVEPDIVTAEAVAEQELVAEPEPVVAAPERLAEPEVAAAEVFAEPEAAADVVAEPEPVAAEAAEPAAPPVEVEPQPEPVRADVVEQPTWRIVAPDTPTPVTNGHPPVPDPSQPAVAATAATPHAPEVEPQWPTSPEWPVAQPDPSLFARGRTSASAATDALWAASARDVIARPAGTPAGGVQPCGSCGLSLSATARFCRRCGSRQGA
jgi:hypothetical protein